MLKGPVKIMPAFQFKVAFQLAAKLKLGLERRCPCAKLLISVYSQASNNRNVLALEAQLQYDYITTFKAKKI